MGERIYVIGRFHRQRDEEPRGLAGPAEVHLVPLYDPAFSRTVWRLYGGAKGLVMW
jgi:hypothetical protein